MTETKQNDEWTNIFRRSKRDKVVKSQKTSFFVIPAEAGIQ